MFGDSGKDFSQPSLRVDVVDVRVADKAVEIFPKGIRIASHARAPNRRGHTTIAEHMLSAHRRYGKWTPRGLIAAGEKIGPSTAACFQAVNDARPHPEQGFRTCLGILSLAKRVAAAKLPVIADIGPDPAGDRLHFRRHRHRGVVFPKTAAGCGRRRPLGRD